MPTSKPDEIGYVVRSLKKTVQRAPDDWIVTDEITGTTTIYSTGTQRATWVATGASVALGSEGTWELYFFGAAQAKANSTSFIEFKLGLSTSSGGTPDNAHLAGKHITPGGTGTLNYFDSTLRLIMDPVTITSDTTYYLNGYMDFSLPTTNFDTFRLIPTLFGNTQILARRIR